MRTAVYAGSFDPLTNGHLWMVEEGARLFDELIVAVGTNPDKRSTFTLEERLGTLRRSTRYLPQVRVDHFDQQFLVKYARAQGAKHVLRGIRSETDYAYERGMRHVNADLDPAITSVFLMPPRDLAEVSSSLVKGLVGPQGWEEVIEDYVPGEVYNSMLLKYHGLQGRFEELWKRLGAQGDPAQAYQDLVGRYSAPDRFHHVLSHVARMLREYDRVKGCLVNPDAVETAAWFHDAILDSTRKDNEERTAILSQEMLEKAKLSPSFIQAVGDHILATVYRATPKTKDQAYLQDMDIAVFGMPDRRFDEYERGIKDEYAWVPEQLFREARIDLLKEFRSREPIYQTEEFRQRYEQAAKRNLQRSIDLLSD
jgi:pantetheine-phosphate adenylyltransferase